MKTSDLQKICGEAYRKMDRPWLHDGKVYATDAKIGLRDGKVYATDGKIGLRVLSGLPEDAVPRLEAESIAKALDNLVASCDRAPFVVVRGEDFSDGKIECEKCGGKGRLESWECENCSGGTVSLMDDARNNYECECKECDGMGTIYPQDDDEARCDDCGGEGWLHSQEKVRIGEVLFNHLYVCRLLDFADVLLIHPVKNSPCFFTWQRGESSGDGILMPVKEHWWADA